MTDSATYTLRLSVKVLGKEPIQGLTDPQNLVAGPVNVQVKQRWPYLILTASEFASELDAEGFLARLKCGLYNMALQYNISFNRTFEQRDITRAEDPIAAARNLAKSFGLSEAEPIQPVHGLTEEEGFVVFRSGENIRFFAMGDASVHVSTGWPRVAESLIQGIMCSKVDEGLSEIKLETALDLYLASFYETSQRAKFLTLITCLEVLAPVTERGETVRQLLSEFQTKIEEAVNGGVNNEDRVALESLSRELSHKKDTSIRQRVRRLILDEAPLERSAREDLATRIVKAYDFRGNMVHEGSARDHEVQEHFDVVLETVKLLLGKRLGLSES